MGEQTFTEKWNLISRGSAGPADEKSLFVDVGREPVTQRQLNLYYYLLFIKEIVERLGGREVLEAGCGRGTMALYLSEYLGCRLTLVDNVPEAIAIAKQEFSRRWQPAEFFVGDVLKTHFPDASFDAVVSIGLAEHFPAGEVGQLFAEQYRLLRPGGAMISLNIPKKFSVQSLNTLMRLGKKLVGAYREDIKKDYFRNSLTGRQYKQLAERAGFKNVAVTYVCPFPIYVPVSMTTDRLVTWVRKTFSLRLRSRFQKYPYKTNSIAAQAHFLVGYKD